MASLSNANCLPLNSDVVPPGPVRFPPGRARLATSPLSTGSPRDGTTIGIRTTTRAVPARTLLADPRDAERLPVVERREVELEVGVFGRVGGQVVRPERQHAELEPRADAPGRPRNREPYGKVLGHSVLRETQDSAARESARPPIRVVAVGAGVVPPPDALVVEGATALVRGASLRARHVDAHGHSVRLHLDEDGHREMRGALG